MRTCLSGQEFIRNTRVSGEGGLKATATDDAKKAIAAALERAATQLLGSDLDGPFSAITYPPGYNFFVEIGQPPYYNPATLGVIDQLCTKDANGIVSLTGSRFSTKYMNVLQNIVYKTSTADKKNLETLETTFSGQKQAVISAYESAFGTITQKQIDDSNCWPANKTEYIQYIINTKYGGNPQQIPPAYANFSSAYVQWISLGQDLNAIASRKPTAQKQVDAAILHTAIPAAKNGGWQMGASSFGVAYTGLPATTAIVGSLTSKDRKLNVTVALTNLEPKTLRMSIGGNTAIRVPEALVSIDFGQTKGRVNRPLRAVRCSPGGLEGLASKVEMSIVYPGITVLQATPLELSADLATGWYRESILSDIVQKTGHDVSGLQLYGSDLSVSDLFGQGKTFARVRTFVVSQEPTIQVMFYGSDKSAIRRTFKLGNAVQVRVADVLWYGATSSGLNVQKIDVVDAKTVVTLAPPEIAGTIPGPQKTAHIIGGVVDYPPAIFANPESGPLP